MGGMSGHIPNAQTRQQAAAGTNPSLDTLQQLGTKLSAAAKNIMHVVS